METAQMVLIGLGALALIVFVAKFGKALLILALLVGVIIAVVVLVGASLGSETLPPQRDGKAGALDAIDDTRQTLSNVRQTTGHIEQTTSSIERTASKLEQAAVDLFRNLVFGVLCVALLAALVAIGWLVIRLKLATRGVGTLHRKRQGTPQRRQVGYSPVVYIVRPGASEVDRWERLEQTHPVVYTEQESEVDRWVDKNYFQF